VAVGKTIKNPADTASGWAHQNAKWLADTPNILDAVRKLDTEWLDRAMIERLFSLKRRQALYLMARIGAEPFGSSWLLNRSALIAGLTSILDSPAFEVQMSRRQGLAEALADSRARAIPIRVTPEDVRRTALPEGVVFERHRLTVDFKDSEQLLTRLYQIATFMANDFDAFRASVEGI
jgi:hypothetical protein